MQISWLLVKISFFILLWISFFYNFFTHIFLWAHLIYSKYKNKKIIGPSFSILLKSFIIEIICTLLSIVVAQLNFLKSTKHSQLYNNSMIPGGTPVLFIHGYLHNKLVWFWFMYKLKQQTKEKFTLFSIDLFPKLASITTLAKLVQEQITEIKKLTKSSKIILIGHSMGGILASYYGEYLAKLDEIEKIIIIASPLQGTFLANFGIGQSPQEMLPNSKLLIELNDRIKNSKIPYFLLGSKIDNVIIPWQSGLLSENTTKNTCVLPDHGHLRPLISSQVIKQVFNWISS